uniref:AB hydrolase-1 domain-containing protein n=1 Tax=Phytophthora ramorum TaxID=164328 RepID=H3GNJ8_PHYRM
MASQWPHAFMRTAEGITLHYVDVGPRDALPVVLVHGWPDLWFGWRHQIQALQSTYRLIVPDLRGFGQSSTPQNVEAYGAKNVTNDLAALLDGLNIEKAVFAGHDWGGYQESVASIGNAVGSTLLTTPTLEDESKPIVGTLQGVTHSPDPIFTQRSAMLSEEEMQYYVDQYSRSKFQSTCQYYATRDIDFKDEQGLPSVINHPAMFIAAANDHVLKPELARKMARFLPNLETHVVDDAGHWVLWEQTARVNALLKTWLAKIPAPPRSDRCKL